MRSGVAQPPLKSSVMRMLKRCYGFVEVNGRDVRYGAQWCTARAIARTREMPGGMVAHSRCGYVTNRCVRGGRRRHRVGVVGQNTPEQLGSRRVYGSATILPLVEGAR